MNGRGDDTMTMLAGYAHMVDFFTGFEWWKTEPHDELVTNGAYCLADPGRTYALYLPHGQNTTVKLEPGSYEAEWFSALSRRDSAHRFRSGSVMDLAESTGSKRLGHPPAPLTTPPRLEG